MNKIKTIALLLILCAGKSLFPQSGVQAGGNTEVYESVCALGCASSKPKVKILNTKNRYTEKGAMQRRMYPRFMHSNIRPVKEVCDCNVCHIDAASRNGRPTKTVSAKG